MQVTRAASRRNGGIECASCHESVPAFDIVNVGSIDKGYRKLCSRCFNIGVAELGGINGFEHLQFQPVAVRDRAGKMHKFHFRTRLFGKGVAMDAFEVRAGHPAGYQFQIIGRLEDDLLILLGKLVEKIRRGLSRKHLKRDGYGTKIADRVVCGVIGWDDAVNGSIPLLNVDGREITWEEFGRMVMAFEGWQFKLEIRDKSEEF